MPMTNFLLGPSCASTSCVLLKSTLVKSEATLECRCPGGAGLRKEEDFHGWRPDLVLCARVVRRSATVVMDDRFMESWRDAIF